MREAIAWVLNFDAEYELERGVRYAPTARMIERTRELAKQMASTLPEGDRVLGLHDELPSTGRAWCPTPRALRALRAVGCTPPEAPCLAVLRRVNERGFALAHADPDELPGAARVTSREELVARLASHPEISDWLLKRAFGVAGRGQRPVCRELTPSDLAWIDASLRTHALYVEPRVAIERELSVHGWVQRDTHSIRSIREQRIERGAWTGGARVQLEPHLERALIGTAERVALALRAANYHGPFGIDAYEWRPTAGTPTRLRALSEINARYCMGWDANDGWDG